MESSQNKLQKNKEFSQTIMQLFVTLTFVFGVVCFSAVFAGNPELEEHFKETLKKCAEDSGIDLADLESVKNGEAAADEKMNCFGACILKGVNVLDEEGTVHKEVAIDMIPEDAPRDEAIKLIETCAEHKGKDDCDTAGLIFKCLLDNKAAQMFKVPEE
ncbi:general odorant-binding protein 19d-like [Neodiprion virginianus]|uniref:general odorant-binding protein 19d-like n=1 Tax=Neodiprion virginianus TaxID=2961670 RepID=UPI001ED97483|nr:general odorant-binding protein 19d-like isoform X2 [Neodiprion fabricii]XP_046625106.1 general odorant-binding protein 19d-like [Neodiprion virginianus]